MNKKIKIGAGIFVILVVLGIFGFGFVHKISNYEQRQPYSELELSRQQNGVEKDFKLESPKQQNTSREIRKNSHYSYCKPDEDPDFKRTREDDSYIYYAGDKLIWGTVSQYGQNGSVTFDTSIDQSCAFQLTKGFVVDEKLVRKDFNIDDAWENGPRCNSKDGNPDLSGRYVIRVKGFKVPKAYLQNYDSKHILSQFEMQRYSFFVDYDGVEEVDFASHVICPIVSVPY